MSRWTARRWLTAFRDCGGLAWLHPRGLMIGWKVYGRSDEDHAAARDLYGQLEADPRRWDAVALQVAWSD